MFNARRKGIFIPWLVGASLSKPHTSIMQVWIYLYMFACLFGPTTYCKFQMSTFKYFMKIYNHEACDDQLRPEFQRQQPRVKTTEFEAHMASCICLSQLQTTDRQTSRQTTYRWYAQWLKLLQVRAMYKLCSRDSVHDLLSPCTCSYSSCPDWQRTVINSVAIHGLCAMT